MWTISRRKDSKDCFKTRSFFWFRKILKRFQNSIPPNGRFRNLQGHGQMHGSRRVGTDGDCGNLGVSNHLHRFIRLINLLGNHPVYGRLRIQVRGCAAIRSKMVVTRRCMKTWWPPFFQRQRVWYPVGSLKYENLGWQCTGSAKFDDLNRAQNPD